MSEEKVSMDLHGYLIIREQDSEEDRWEELCGKLLDSKGCIGYDDTPPDGIFGNLNVPQNSECVVFFFILEEMRNAAVRIVEEYDDVVMAEGISDEPIRFDFGDGDE